MIFERDKVVTRRTAKVRTREYIMAIRTENLESSLPVKLLRWV